MSRYSLRLVAVVAMFLLALVSCADKKPPFVVPTNYSPTSCAEACEAGPKLCEGRDPMKPRTGTCMDLCKRTEEGGGDFRTGCFSSAKDCASYEACGRLRIRVWKCGI